MDLILYLNGEEGLIALNTLSNNNILLIVLPSECNNEEIITYAENNNIKIQFRDKDTALKLINRNATIISCAFPYKIYKEETATVKQAVNFHAAILPKYRGRHGNVWAMINDEKYLGVTAHEIDDKFDNGKILQIEKFEINDDLTLNDIQAKLKYALAKLLKQFVEMNGDSSYKSENITNIYWRSRIKEDSHINWNLNQRQVFLFIRALNRSPIFAYSRYGNNNFQFMKVETSNKEFSDIAGTVHCINNEFYIVTGDRKSVKIIKYTMNNKPLNNKMVLH